jgi:hypothetical protein
VACTSHTSSIAASCSVTCWRRPCAISSTANAVEPVAHRGQVQRRREAVEHPAPDQPVEPGLHGAAGHPQPPRALQDPQPRLVGQQQQQAGVELVEQHR